MNVDPLLVIGACALLLVLAIWAASRAERHQVDGEEPSTLDTRGPDDR